MSSTLTNISLPTIQKSAIENFYPKRTNFLTRADFEEQAHTLHNPGKILSPQEYASRIQFDEKIPIDANLEDNTKAWQISKRSKKINHEGIKEIDLWDFKFGNMAELSFSNLGANLLSLKIQGKEITDSTLMHETEPEDLKISQIQGLNPISSPPGRIEDLIYYSDDDSKTRDFTRISDHKIDKSYPRNNHVRIHGLLFKKKWEVKSHKTNADGALQVIFEFDTRKDQEYRDLFGDLIYESKYTIYPRGKNLELVTEISARNVSSQGFFGRLLGYKPKKGLVIGLQSHPYFLAKKWQLNARKYLELDRRSLPTGKLLDAKQNMDLRTMSDIKKSKLDHPYTDLYEDDDGVIARIEREDGLKIDMIWDIKQAPFAIAYNGKANEGKVCIEPGTSCPNSSQLAFNNRNCNFDPRSYCLKEQEKLSLWWALRMDRQSLSTGAKMHILKS